MLVSPAVSEEVKRTDRQTDRQNCASYVRCNHRVLIHVFSLRLMNPGAFATLKRAPPSVNPLLLIQDIETLVKIAHSLL